MLGTALKRWNWLEEGLIPLSAILMHAAWAYPLFALFTRNTITGEQNPGFTFWLCLSLLVGGVLAGKLAVRNRLGIVIVAAGGLAAIWISLLLAVPMATAGGDRWLDAVAAQFQLGSPGAAVPIPFVVGFAAAFLWWRGVRIVSEEHAETIGSFAAGVTALIGLFLLSRVLPAELGHAPSDTAVFAPIVFLGACVVAIVFAFSARMMGPMAMVVTQMAITIGVLALAFVLPVGPRAEQLGGWSLLFIASGLITLALNGALHVLREQEQRTGVLARVDRYWAVTVIGVVVVVLVLGVLVGQIVSPGMIAEMFGWLKPIWAALVRVVMFVIFVLAYLFFALFEPLLAGIGQGQGQTEPGTFDSPLGLQDLEDLKNPVEIPPMFSRMIEVILIAGLVALLIWFFVRAVRRQTGRTEIQDEILETRETILSLDLVRSQLSGLLDGLRRQRPPPLFVELGADQDTRRQVRALYQRVLARAIELDLPRRRWYTPARYQRALYHLWSLDLPEVRHALETLTAVYEVARYGIEPPTHEQVMAAQDAFVQIDAALQPKTTP
jgi:hypothetical protein